MHTDALKTWVVNAVDELKGKDICVLDVAPITPMTDCFVIVTGTSSRHVAALAQRVQEKAHTLGLLCRLEGKPGSEWILLDLGNLVLHVMSAEVREYYCLEKLWVNIAAPTELEAAVA